MLSSPGYEDDHFYPNNVECAWMLEAEKADDNIVVEFVDEFGVYDHNENQCYHWLELFTKDEFDNPGYRLNYMIKYNIYSV